jgi:hypothetical protein
VAEGGEALLHRGGAVAEALGEALEQQAGWGGGVEVEGEPGDGEDVVLCAGVRLLVELDGFIEALLADVALGVSLSRFKGASTHGQTTSETISMLKFVILILVLDLHSGVSYLASDLYVKFGSTGARQPRRIYSVVMIIGGRRAGSNVQQELGLARAQCHCR